MLSDKIQKALNEQIVVEAESSDVYLAMASWCDNQGFSGSAKFFYAQAEEERQHMLKIFHFINDVGGHAVVGATPAPQVKFSSLAKMFETALGHEQRVTATINKLADLALTAKDFATFNFLQWFVTEQLEEEKQFRGLIEMFGIVGKDSRGDFLADREIGKLGGV